MKDQRKYLKIVLSLLIIAGMLSCEHSAISLQSTPSKGLENELTVPVVIVQELPLIINYYIDSIETKAEVDSFKTKFNELEQEFIFALNRMDAHRLSPGDKLVIPDTLTSNFLDYSPFPPKFEMLDSIPKAVLISRRIQGFALYENGNLLRWGPVSSGKRATPTPAGLFYGNYKARSKISTVDESWIMPYYFNFANFEGVGVHQYSMPGFPASHACVRLRKEDAISIYNWADQWKLEETGQTVRKNGTPFLVYGDYDFERPVPWLQLVENPNSNYMNAEEMKVLREYLDEYRRDIRNFADPVIPEQIISVPVQTELETL